MKRNTFFYPICFSFALIIVSFVFQAKEWPFGHELYFLAVFLIGLFSFFRFLYKQEKTTKDFVKLVMVISLLISYSIIPLKLDILYLKIFGVLSATSLATWVGLESIDYITGDESIEKKKKPIILSH